MKMHPVDTHQSPTTPHALDIHLQYSFESRGQSGADVENPLFDLLTALQSQGSITHAAKAMGRSYRHVWGEVRRWETVLRMPLVTWEQGKRAQLTAFALRLMWAERQARSRLTPHLEALRAELRHVLAHAHDDAYAVVEMLASHDMQLPALQALVERHNVHLSLSFAGSAEALRHLNAGVCALAGFHMPRLTSASQTFANALRPLLRPGDHKLIGSHQRTQGLIFSKAMAYKLGTPTSIEAVFAPQSLWRFVNRQPGSGTRLLTDHLCAEAGLDILALSHYDAAVEFTHVAVAASIAAGEADVGMGVEAAAATHGLGFMPLVEEDYYLVCLKDQLHSPAIQRIRDALKSPAWGRALNTLPGYHPHQPGDVLSLTRALPWWAFAKAKQGPTATKAGAQAT